MVALRTRILPEHQRRTLEELSEDLEFTSGDTIGKRSAFWTMLTLSAVIATAGVVGDSTATVIGAMIIAPLSTPIMGMALAITKRRQNQSVWYVLAGAALVVVVGWLFAFLLPADYNLMGNSQIASRVSPDLVDLIAALATGLAGAVALARRDVAAVLPGVAIAISLVPPLAVVGVCLGAGAPSEAFGAALLFVSNLVSLVLAGMFVFTVLGYATESLDATGRTPRKTYVTLGVLSALILVLLGVNTTTNYLTTRWEHAVRQAAQSWVSGTPGASVDDVQLHATTFQVTVIVPDEPPPTSELLESLRGKVPDGMSVEVVDMRGRQIDAGKVD